MGGVVLEILTSDNTNGVLSFTHFVMQQQVYDRCHLFSHSWTHRFAFINCRKHFKLNLVTFSSSEIMHRARLYQV